MGLAYFPVLEQPIPGLEPHLLVSGKGIAAAMPALDELCAELGVRPLSSFHSESAEETFDKIGEPVPDDLPEQPVSWFDPAAGRETIAALLQRLAAQAGGKLAVTDEVFGRRKTSVDGILSDLRALDAVLAKAEEERSQFRLKIDI